MLDKYLPITELIVPCALPRGIAKRAGLEPETVDAVIWRLAQTVKLDLYPNGTCLECGESAEVYAIDRASWV